MEQNSSNALAFYEIAAKKESIQAHKLLSSFHESNGDFEKSIKHLKVVASAGDKDSMDGLMNAYREKEISKDDLTQTLRAFQASNDAMKNRDRDDARLLEEAYKKGVDAPAGLFK